MVRELATTEELLQLDPHAPQARRSSMEIMCDILEVVSSGMERPTHIIYRANISWKVLNNSLRTLISNELVFKANDGKREVYRLTQKGYSVLHMYKDLKSRLLHSDGVLTRELYLRGF